MWRVDGAWLWVEVCARLVLLVDERSHRLIIHERVEEPREEPIVHLVNLREERHPSFDNPPRPAHERADRHQRRREEGRAVPPAQYGDRERCLERGGHYVEEEETEQRVHTAHAAREHTRELACPTKNDDGAVVMMAMVMNA